MKNVIYQIQNIQTKTIYIGSAKNFKSRRRVHLCNLRKNKHHSKYMQRAYNKYGLEVFKFTILESDITSDKLIEREQYYIDKLNPKYNMDRFATRRNCKVSKTTRIKISKANKGKPIHDEKSKKAISKALMGNRHGAGKTFNRKVTKEVYDQIMALRTSGLGCRKVAAQTGLSKTTIRNVFNNKFNYGAE